MLGCKATLASTALVKAGSTFIQQSELGESPALLHPSSVSLLAVILVGSETLTYKQRAVPDFPVLGFIVQSTASKTVIINSPWCSFLIPVFSLEMVQNSHMDTNFVTVKLRH